MKVKVRYTLALLIVFIFTYASLVHAAAPEFNEAAICDRKGGFCADYMGVSVALTKMYLGEKAERKLMLEIKKVGIESFDATTFTMSGGLTCETKFQQCWTTRLREKTHPKAMQTLFGK